MVATNSTMLALGTPAPAFNLNDVISGEDISLDTYVDKKGLLVMFICAHCPFVIKINEQLAALANDYIPKDIGIVAICSNDAVNYPDDSVEKLKEQAIEYGFSFAYCQDESQLVAQAYTAACTPDFFLFDGDHKLFYRGQLDSSRPGNDLEATGEDMRAALDALLAGETSPETQTPSIGCNIKWKAGNAPDYFG